MAAPALTGPLPLNAESVKLAIPRKSPGSYVLGTMTDGELEARHVGRSDTDVADRLTAHVGQYPSFCFAYATSALAAFEQECELYHAYMSSSGAAHPARAPNSGWRCPRCAVFD
ncbi:MAG: hypothetical protein FJX35_02100 [Alphaproteobacteria bacterium]|nr:hypothetical protein [Alphaproteobacteria bacterium]